MLLLLLVTILIFPSYAEEDWRCFNWPGHRNFTRVSPLFDECNRECKWFTTCTPCRILGTDLYSCLDTDSNIDSYKYACGDLKKQYSCLMRQSEYFWGILAGAFCLIVSCLSGLFYYLLHKKTKYEYLA